MAQPIPTNSVSIDELCINSLRILAMDAVQAAKSGHPGAPMALAPLGYVLWTRHLRHNPADPAWRDRDRFVLSCGHASMLLYGLLHLTGYDLPLEELRNFRQLGSSTPGHPEYGRTPGVETTTGPLGQGFGNAVGMAIAEAHLAAHFNRPGHNVVDHRTYVLASDGDLMEGVSHEVASLAGHLGLGKLIVFYDDNRITIDGPTSLAYSEDVEKRFEAYGWHVQRVEDGNDLEGLDQATEVAKDEMGRPSLIIVSTHIAYGSPTKQDSAAAHGAALGEEEVRLTKKNLAWPSLEPFHLPTEAIAAWRRCEMRGVALQSEWEKRYQAFEQQHPEQARELDRRSQGNLPADWDRVLPSFQPAKGPLATRSASGTVLNALAETLPELVGGSADLAGSVKTVIENGGAFEAADPAGRNIHFGVREHAMGTILNGLALHGGVRPYGGTFLIFSDYMRPAIRLAAMMQQRVIYLFSHDSIGLGEDGPTHQPIETLLALRAIPGLAVMRPADAAEVVEAWRVALTRRAGPVAMILTRQKVPILDRSGLGSAKNLAGGGYVLSEPQATDPRAIVMASGSEVALALEAQQQLDREGIPVRVVSMPCLELFAAQPEKYRESVLPPEVSARLAVEAAHPSAWYRWVGDRGDVLGIERFGESAPYQDLYEHLGLTPLRIVERVKALLSE